MAEWLSRSLTAAGVAVLDCEHRTPAARPHGQPYIAIPDIQDGRVVLERARRISDSDLVEWTRRTRPVPRDVIVTRRGRVGDSAPIPEGMECAIGQNLVILRSDGGEVDQAFLRWAVRSPQWWSEVERLRNVGAIFSSLNVRDIAEIRLPFPPKPEQRAIAEVLGALDDKIAANTRLATTADEWVRAEWARTCLSADSTRPVGSLADSIRDVIDPRGTSSDHVYVGLEHIPRRQMWLPDHGLAESVTSGKSGFREGDVLFGKLRPYFHKVVAAPKSGICSTDVLVLRAQELALRGFVLAALASDATVAAATASSEGTRMPRTSWKDLAAVVVPWPGSRAAEAFSSEVEALRATVDARLAENLTLAATRNALLPALMSGTLRVRDAERVVETFT